MSANVNPRSYLKVLVGLLILTVVTVLVAKYVDLGRAGNIVVGLIIAGIKATLVVLIFMHMKYEARWWLGLVLFPVTLVMIILFSNFADTAFGDYTTPALKRIPHAGQSGGGAH